MAQKLHTWMPILVAVLFPASAFPQNRVPEFQSRFAHDTDPVHRARLMPQLEEAEFAAIAKSADDGKFPDALDLLEEFRDQAESCEKGLDAKSINAEKHPNGFKQLQFALRESMRHLDSLLVSFTTDEQAPFLKLRGDLERLDRHVIRELFPSGPNNEPVEQPNAKPNSAPSGDPDAATSGEPKDEPDAASDDQPGDGSDEAPAAAPGGQPSDNSAQAASEDRSSDNPDQAADQKGGTQGKDRDNDQDNDQKDRPKDETSARPGSQADAPSH